MTAKRPTRIRVGVAVVAAAALFTLSACGSDDVLGGSAARVGDVKVSVNQIHDQSDEVTALAAQYKQPAINGTELNRAQVSNWVDGQLAEQAAEANGIVITEGEVDRFLESVANSNGTTRDKFAVGLALQQGYWVPPSQLDEYALAFLRNQALAKKLAGGATGGAAESEITQALGDAAEAAGVEIAPRFGSWDPSKIRVQPPLNDVSAPANLTGSTPEPTPSAP